MYLHARGNGIGIACIYLKLHLSLILQNCVLKTVLLENAAVFHIAESWLT